MSDVHNKRIRSYNMSRVKGKDTKPELIVRKHLHSKGLRYRLHDTRLPGKPDVVLPAHNAVVQVKGCFWHKHQGCEYFVVPKTRTEWWMDKINKTVLRDQNNEDRLNQMGWRVFDVWECELKPAKKTKSLSDLFEKITCSH